MRPHRFINTTFTCAALSATIVACNNATGPVPLPAGAREFAPEPVFQQWWEQMEECSGIQSTFDQIRWFVVPGEEPFRVQDVDHAVVGYWDPREDRIVLLEFLPNQRAPTIRHEMLHAIIQRTDHPKHFFNDLCGTTIDGPDSPD